MESYWNKTGKHQANYDRLWDLLVPVRGQAPTFHGEVLRAASKLYYDHFNNGSCNFDLPVFREWRRLVWKMRTFLDISPGEIRFFVKERRSLGSMSDADKETCDAVMDAVVEWVDQMDKKFPQPPMTPVKERLHRSQTIA